MRAIALTLILFASSSVLAAPQTDVKYTLLSPGHTFDLRGERFESVISVEETQRPPGDGVNPVVIGPVAEGTDYLIDAVAGTIQAAPGHAEFWAKITYTWDDAPTAEEVEAAQAAADCSIALPALRARIIQDLADLSQEEARAQQIQDQMVAQLAAFASDPALPASPTTAQLRSAVNTLSARDQEVVAGLRDAALSAKRNIDRTRGLIKIVECQAGIHVQGQ